MNQGLIAGFGQAAVDPSKVIDLTNAGEDYSLQVGETAYIHYSNVTSVPLHIQTSDSIYKMSMYNNLVNPTSGATFLSPNNITYTNGSIDFTTIYNSYATTSSAANITAQGYADGVGQNKFFIGSGICLMADLDICTRLLSKVVRAYAIEATSSTGRQQEVTSNIWNDTTTAWISLGTITFPFAQSGVIIVRRIL